MAEFQICRQAYKKEYSVFTRWGVEDSWREITVFIGFTRETSSLRFKTPEKASKFLDIFSEFLNSSIEVRFMYFPHGIFKVLYRVNKRLFIQLTKAQEFAAKIDKAKARYNTEEIISYPMKEN